MSEVNRVLITGGTHGNELTGVYLVKKFERHPERLQRPSFQTICLLANPRAAAENIRYIHDDLNRCFKNISVSGTTNSSSYERQRAEEINLQYGHSGQTPIDLLVDIHSTTSNAGTMLIVDCFDDLTLKLSASLSLLYPEIKIYSSSSSGRRYESIRAIAKHSIGIEVGPISHGMLRASYLEKVESIVLAVLDFVERYNQQKISSIAAPLVTHQYLRTLDYPKDCHGQLAAAIHPDLEGRDYEPLSPGDPVFMTFEHKAIHYEGKGTVYPVFINETAYYEKGIAMYLTKKQSLQEYSGEKLNYYLHF